MNPFQTIGSSIKAFPADFGDFGFRVALYKFTSAVRGEKTADYMKAVSAYTAKVLQPLLDRYKEPGYQSILCEKKQLTEIPIWFCLFSASDSMTDAEKLCYQRLQRMAPEHAHVHLLTLKNISEYIDLPPLIIDRYQSRKLNLNCLQDYVRAAILSAYGGLWIDPCVFVLNKIQQQILTAELYSVKTAETDLRAASLGRWSTSVLSVRKNHAAICFVRDAILYWWDRFDRPIDEAQFDFFLSTAVLALPQVRFIMDTVKPSNPDFYAFGSLLNQPFDGQVYGRLKEKNEFLCIAENETLFKETADHTPTFFGKLYFNEIYSM